MMNEKSHNGISGWLILPCLCLPIVILLFILLGGGGNPSGFLAFLFFPLIILTIFLAKGFFIIQPGMSKTITFTGNNLGATRKSGLR